MQRNGRFSFSRLITNAVPNFAADNKQDVDLAPSLADALVRYQLSLPNPPYLAPLSFKIAGLVDSDSNSRKVYASLVKHGYLTSAPEVNPSSRKSSMAESAPLKKTTDFNQSAGLPVNTHKIGRNFANQMAVISVHAQRKLIGVLFFWEEECKRWLILGEEEEEILKAIELEKTSGLPNYDESVSFSEESEPGARRGSVMHQLNVSLQAVRMKRELVPSMRAEATVNVTTGVGNEDLPNYALSSGIGVGQS